jgi:hypothetical protein
MATVDCSCCMPSTIRWHGYSVGHRPASGKDVSLPTSSGDGLVEGGLRVKPADRIRDRTPARRFFQGYAVRDPRRASPRPRQVFPPSRLAQRRIDNG